MSLQRNGPQPDSKTVQLPSAARRVLMFGYYDGALDGVLELDGGDLYRFDSVAEPEELVRQKSRSYTLRRLPKDALDRLVAIIEPYMQPRWPLWIPVWNFPDDATETDVEVRTDAILDEAGPVSCQLTTDDYYSFSRFTIEPVQAAPVATRD